MEFTVVRLVGEERVSFRLRGVTRQEALAYVAQCNTDFAGSFTLA